MDNYSKLHPILVRLFNDILDFQIKAIADHSFKDITENDMHVIEAIGVGNKKNMTKIASTLGVTVGSLTIAMNSLVKKGYVIRERGEEDRRVVYIQLSGKGEQAFLKHKEFHQKMIEAMLDVLEVEEKKALIKALYKLDKWIQNNKDFAKEI